MAAPRVTVVVPTYNRAGLLRETIASILAQTYEDFRLVVSDNASTDETPRVVAGFADERVEHVRRPLNLGLLGNFNASLGEELAREAEYSLVVCDDDLLRPRFLERAVAVLDANPRVGMVHTAFDVIDDEGRVVEGATNWTYGLGGDTVETGADFIAESMTWGCRVCSSAALMRSAALADPPFEEEDLPAIDFGLWLRLALDWEVAFVAEPLAAYRVHGGSETSAFGAPAGAGYRAGLEWVRKREQVKRRFLAAHGRRLPGAAALVRRVSEARRHELLVLVRQATLPERDPRKTVRLLSWAARADRRVLAEPAAWKLLAASALPRPVRERALELRRR
jgi:hypothetical protein